MSDNTLTLAEIREVYNKLVHSDPLTERERLLTEAKRLAIGWPFRWVTREDLLEEFEGVDRIFLAMWDGYYGA